MGGDKWGRIIHRRSPDRLLLLCRDRLSPLLQILFGATELQCLRVAHRPYRSICRPTRRANERRDDRLWIVMVSLHASEEEGGREWRLSACGSGSGSPCAPDAWPLIETVAQDLLASQPEREGEAAALPAAKRARRSRSYGAAAIVKVYSAARSMTRGLSWSSFKGNMVMLPFWAGSFLERRDGPVCQASCHSSSARTSAGFTPCGVASKKSISSLRLPRRARARRLSCPRGRAV